MFNINRINNTMLDIIKQNPYISIIVLLVLLWILFRKNGLLEGFVTCYYNKTVYLQDVTGGASEAVVDLENNRGRLYVSINANLPYHKGGVFGTTVSNYIAYLVNKKHPHRKDLPPIMIGHLLRYGDRRYRLKNEVLGNYHDYSHLIVVRHALNEDYPDVVVLEGEVN